MQVCWYKLQVGYTRAWFSHTVNNTFPNSVIIITMVEVLQNSVCGMEKLVNFSLYFSWRFNNLQAASPGRKEVINEQHVNSSLGVDP